MAEIYTPQINRRMSTRNSFKKLLQPSRRTKQGQNCLSFIGPSIWNKLPESIKDSKNLINFKHNLKDYFLKDLEGREINVFAF